MSEIKCKYIRDICTLGYDGKHLCEHHDAEGWYIDGCDFIQYAPNERKDGRLIIKECCKYLGSETVMFCKNVKQWECDANYFEVYGRAGLLIPINNIRELVLDGETIIKDKEKGAKRWT